MDLKISDFVGKFGKWGSFIFMIIGIGMALFKEFTPQYEEWRKTYGEDYEEEPEDETLGNPFDGDLPQNA